MEAKSVAKVGAVVLLAIGLFVGLYLYLAHLNPDAYKVYLKVGDTRGIGKQSVVRMQGVGIGEVQSIDLDTRHRPIETTIILSIHKEVRIPNDSQFVIASGLLIPNPQIEVVPGMSAAVLAHGAKVVGEPPKGGLDALGLGPTLKKFDQTFDNVNQNFAHLSKKLDGVLDQTQTLVATTTETVRSARGIIGDPQLKASLLATTQNFRDVSQDARKFSRELPGELKSLLTGGQDKIDKVFNTTLDLANKLGNTIDDANAIVRKLSDQVTDPRFQQALQETTEQANTTLARVNQVASDLHQLAGDPEFQSDFKQTVANLKDASEKGKEAADRLNSLLERLIGGNGQSGIKSPRLNLPQVRLVGNIFERVDRSRLRVDVDSIFQFGKEKRNLLDLGLYDLGQNTRLNLQLGNKLSDDLTARYGLYASKLGAGLDWTPAQGLGVRADLYDTTRPRLDVKGLFRVNNGVSLWIGSDNLLRKPVPVIGVQLRN